MAKPASVLIKMVSTADTGYFYVKKKNTRTSCLLYTSPSPRDS